MRHNALSFPLAAACTAAALPLAACAVEAPYDAAPPDEAVVAILQENDAAGQMRASASISYRRAGHGTSRDADPLSNGRSRCFVHRGPKGYRDSQPWRGAVRLRGGGLPVEGVTLTPENSSQTVAMSGAASQPLRVEGTVEDAVGLRSLTIPAPAPVMMTTPSGPLALDPTRDLPLAWSGATGTLVQAFVEATTADGGEVHGYCFFDAYARGGVIPREVLAVVARDAGRDAKLGLASFTQAYVDAERTRVWLLVAARAGELPLSVTNGPTSG